MRFFHGQACVVSSVKGEIHTSRSQFCVGVVPHTYNVLVEGQIFVTWMNVVLWFVLFILFKMVTNTMMQRLDNRLRDTLFFFNFLNCCWLLIVTRSLNLLLGQRRIRVILLLLSLDLLDCLFNQSLDL